jgi:hypothetical protein
LQYTLRAFRGRTEECLNGPKSRKMDDTAAPHIHKPSHCLLISPCLRDRSPLELLL